MNKVEENVFQVIEKIENKVSVPQKGNNWINLSDLGAQLRNNGIDYNMLGYDKLTSFEKQLQHDSAILHYQWQLEKAIKVIENQRFDIILK